MWQDIKNIYHLGRAIVANVQYGFPSKELTIIGVTGTDGKTTTVNLIYHILNASGYEASMISTTGAVIHGKEYKVGFHVTTPSSFLIQKFLKKTLIESKKKHKIERFLVLEMTSHALHQHRAHGIHFKAAALTNVTSEHLDYHKTYDNYLLTKAKLLQQAEIVVINKDDASYKQISKIVEKDNKQIFTYGIQADANITPKKYPFKTNLLGTYNKYNILAAIGVCASLGVKKEAMRQAIATFTLPKGRAEVVYKKDFTIIIDFAHTPNAFAQLLFSIKQETKGRIIHVFGSAGQRDVIKRPEMGKISAQYTDVIVLTSEDPRTESVEKIMEDITQGISNFQFQIFNEKTKINFHLQKEGKYLFKIPNRQEAISFAISLAREGDVVLLTGKGHEESMNYGNGEEPWSEYQAVEKALSQLR